MSALIEPAAFRLSDRGLCEIAEHEGVVPGPYLDSAGVWTFGVGHTRAAGDPDPAAMPRGMPADMGDALEAVFAVFRQDVASYEARLRARVTVALEQHEIDALISFDFNTGGVWFREKSGRMVSAVAVQRLNAGDRAGCAAALMNWLRPPELRKRRAAERALFLTGDYAANGSAIPIWNVDAAGKLKGIRSNIDGDDVLAAMGREPAADPLGAWWSAAPPEARAWLKGAPA